MTIVLNGMLGGPDQIVFHSLNIDLRKKIKIEFENNNTEKHNYRIIYFIMVNGEISEYYDTTGIHRVAYYQKKKEIRLDLCFAETIPDITYNQALTMMKEQFIKSIEKISDLVEKKKLDLPTDIISTSFNRIFSSMENMDKYKR